MYHNIITNLFFLFHTKTSTVAKWYPGNDSINFEMSQPLAKVCFFYEVLFSLTLHSKLSLFIAAIPTPRGYSV